MTNKFEVVVRDPETNERIGDYIVLAPNEQDARISVLESSVYRKDFPQYVGEGLWAALSVKEVKD